MRVFVYDDNCGPCVPMARLLARRTRGRLDVVPFSTVREELTEEEIERFADEALYAAGPKPLGGATLPDVAHRWGHEAIACGLAASHHRADRLIARIILAPGVSMIARAGYRWFSHNRWRFGGTSCGIPASRNTLQDT
ncbi:DCC1-like thiol-disulfide oxidoreductase family protein [Kocuria massiliensis]|uniref:DCC1-like thiol-disulfide oxidoreductase family protein n=1 Tax=Kocuria massiliensis TaxID=1926282 RepID=UPI0022B98B65|nr:DCC1-like thiol-disulfide oxidoreductase family protein [Kocuria massiliensis]